MAHKAEILTSQQPSWISDFCLHHTVWKMVSLNSSNLKMWVFPFEFCSYVVYTYFVEILIIVYNSIFSLRAAILDFWLPLTPYNLENIFIEFLNLENMGRAVGFMQLSCIQSELLVCWRFWKKNLYYKYTYLRSESWISEWQYNIRRCNNNVSLRSPNIPI